MSSPESSDSGVEIAVAREAHVLEVNEVGLDGESDPEIAPLLVDIGRKSPRMTIFSVSYPNKRTIKESTPRAVETEVTLLLQNLLWAWNGSRYSGLLCMASSAIIYYFMEVLTETFPG